MEKLTENVRGGKWLTYTLVASLIILIWSGSFFLVSHANMGEKPSISELATLLFGAASIALFVFSLFIAVLAIFGWQDIQSQLKHVDLLDSDLKSKIETLEREFRNKIDTLETDARRRVETMAAEVRGEADLTRRRAEALELEVRNKA